MFDPTVWAVWKLRQIYTQTNAGGGAITIDISPGLGNLMFLLYGRLGADDYAADRALTANIIGTDNRTIALYLSDSTIDNEIIFIPSAGAAHAVGGQVMPNESDLQRLIGGDDFFSTTAAALAQNETYSINLRFLVYVKDNDNPSISSARSGGTVGAPTTSFNEVI